MKSCSPWARNSAPVSTVRSKLNVVLSVGFRTQRRAQRNKDGRTRQNRATPKTTSTAFPASTDRSNPLEDLPGEEVFRRYRFLPETIIFILRQLPDLSARTRRKSPCRPLLQSAGVFAIPSDRVHAPAGRRQRQCQSLDSGCLHPQGVQAHQQARPSLCQLSSRRRSYQTKQAFAAISGKIYVLFTIIISKNNPV